MLTYLRIIMVPVIAFTLYTANYELGMGLILLSGLTDWLDGFIAREFGGGSKLGAFLDPLADKLTMITIFPLLSYAGAVGVLTATAVILRDIIIMAGVYYLQQTRTNVKIAPTFISKLNTGFQLLLIYAALGHLISPTIPGGYAVKLIDMTVLATTLYSGYDYYKIFKGLAQK